MYKNLFLTKKPTDQVWHLILSRVEKGEVILDDSTPKSYLILLAENSHWTLSTKLGTRLLRQDEIAERFRHSRLK